MWSPVRTSSPETPRSTVVDMCRLPSQELNQNPTPESRVIAPRGRKQRQGSSHQDDAARIANAASVPPTRVAASAVTTTRALGSSTDPPGAASGLGQLSGLLPRDQLTEESGIQVDLTKESVRLPLYQGKAGGQTVWFVLLDASDAGLAHDLGVNFAPKLANLGIGCPACVQTVTLDSPTPAQNPFGQALVHFKGAPDFSPTRIAE